MRPTHEDPALGPPTVLEPEVVSKQRTAPRYKVLMHDDDVTPMDFVVDVLQRVFGKTHAEAMRLMLEAHGGDVVLVEVVPLEQAELHVDQAHSLARARKYPLTLTIEPE